MGWKSFEILILEMDLGTWSFSKMGTNYNKSENSIKMSGNTGDYETAFSTFEE